MPFIATRKTINVKKILAVINATYAVAKRKPEKLRLAGIRTLTSAIPVQRSNQLSYQANWELVIKLVRNIPVILIGGGGVGMVKPIRYLRSTGRFPSLHTT